MFESTAKAFSIGVSNINRLESLVDGQQSILATVRELKALATKGYTNNSGKTKSVNYLAGNISSVNVEDEKEKALVQFVDSVLTASLAEGVQAIESIGDGEFQWVDEQEVICEIAN